MGLFDTLVKEILEEAESGLVKAAHALLDDANMVVPVNTGELKESGHVEVSGGGVSVVYDADYALEVHESPESSGYKWLERTADMNEDNYVDLVAGGGK